MQVWVLDPFERKTWQIGREHGLPLVSRDEMRGQAINYSASVPVAHVAAIAPGEAIIAGWIGRTWLAHVVFDPEGEHQVKIFHEARELPATRFIEAGDGRWKSTTAAFRPNYMLTFAESKAGRTANQRVLIGRGVAGNSHPLIVDPSDLSVRVMEPAWSKSDTINMRADLFAHAFYYTSVLPPKNDKLGLFRMGLPELQPVPVLSDVKEGHVLFDGEDGEIVNIAGREWWRGRLRDGRLQSFGPVPWHYRPGFVLVDPSPVSAIERGATVLTMIGRSNHYGTLVICGEWHGPFARRGPAQVIFDGSGMSMDEVLDYHSKRWRATVAMPTTPATPTLPAARPIPHPPEVLWKTRGYAESAWSPDGKTIVTVGAAVRAWDAADGRLIADYPVGMTHVTFSPSGRYFATGARDGRGLLWSTAEMKPLHRLEGHQYEIRALAFSWDDQSLVSCCGYRIVRVWNVADGEEHLKMRHRRMGVDWVGFTPDNTRLLTLASGRMCSWDLSRGELVGEIESLHSIVGFLPDKRILAITPGSDDSLIAWDCTDDSSDQLWDRTPGRPVAVSPDGRRLATIQHEGYVEDSSAGIIRLQVWDLATRRELLSQTYSPRSPSVTFSPDGRVLLLRHYLGELVRHELE